MKHDFPLFIEADLWDHLWHRVGQMTDEVHIKAHTSPEGRSRGMMMFIGPDAPDDLVIDVVNTLLNTRRQEASQHS